MNDISGVLEVLPVSVGKDGTPRTSPGDDCLEATHLLHAVDLTVAEDHLGIVLGEPIRDGAQVRGLEGCQHGGAKVVTLPEIITILQAGIARRQGVGPEIVRLGDDLQRRRRFRVESEEAKAEVPRRLDHALAVAGPERRLFAAALRQEMLVAGT